MKRIALLIAALIVLTVATPASAHHRTRVEVMSQNLYIGVDLSRLLGDPLADPPVPPEPPLALLATIQQTDFHSRAKEIAQAIDDFNPDLVGLQEVSLISVPGVTELDYLQILMDEIAAEGESYAIASSVTNADVTLPVPELGTSARVVDRDVIIYRTSTTSVDKPRSANFETNFIVPFAGTAIEFTRGYTMVDAEVGSQEFTFVNTHLEVEGAPCSLDPYIVCQDVQADELEGVLSGITGSVVLVGDINARPGMYAYEAFAGNGYVDTWLERYPYNDEPGFTCCQSETLDNVENELFERIDHIFIRELNPTYVVTTVVGDWDQRKTDPGGLWYSDHGGPWARLYLPNASDDG
jgi:endonuclease/exonuclease/phosphatase family metal-dependent hydrolase